MLINVRFIETGILVENWLAEYFFETIKISEKTLPEDFWHWLPTCFDKDCNAVKLQYRTYDLQKYLILNVLRKVSNTNI